MKQYVVDAFTDKVFTGNPAAVIDLCGHATLATAFVILNYYDTDRSQVSFDTMSGKLTVVQKDDLYEMDFPAYHLKEVPSRS